MALRPADAAERAGELRTRAKEGDAARVAELLQCDGIDVNDADRCSKAVTALHLAATNGHQEVVDLLFRHQAAVDQQERNEAAAHHRSNYLRGRCQFGLTALMRAAEHGHLEVAQLLITHRAEVDKLADPPRGTYIVTGLPGAKTALVLAMENEHQQVASVLIENRADIDKSIDDGSTALMHAAQQGERRLALAACLIENRADVDKASAEGYTALMCAVGSTCPAAEVLPMCALLIESRATIDKATAQGGTPLLLASSEGRLELMALLLERRAGVDYAPSGVTPFWFAESPEAAALLIEHNADIDAATPDAGFIPGELGQMTKLMFAAEEGEIEIAQFLIENGADIDKVNADGHTAREVALRNGKQEVADILDTAHVEKVRRNIVLVTCDAVAGEVICTAISAAVIGTFQVPEGHGPYGGWLGEKVVATMNNPSVRVRLAKTSGEIFWSQAVMKATGEKGVPVPDKSTLSFASFSSD